MQVHMLQWQGQEVHHKKLEPKKLWPQTHSLASEEVPSLPVKRLNWPMACRRNISTPLTMMAPAASASFNSLVFLGV